MRKLISFNTRYILVLIPNFLYLLENFFLSFLRSVSLQGFVSANFRRFRRWLLSAVPSSLLCEKSFVVSDRRSFIFSSYTLIRSKFKYKFSFLTNKSARILTILLLKVPLFSRDVLIAAIKISDSPSYYENDSFDVFSFQTINSHAILNSANKIIQRVLNSIRKFYQLTKYYFPINPTQKMYTFTTQITESMHNYSRTNFPCMTTDLIHQRPHFTID